MCIVKAIVACRSLKIVPLPLEQHINELKKTIKHCCEYCCHHPLPPTLRSQEKIRERQVLVMLLSLFVHEVLFFIPSDKQGHSFLAPKSLLSRLLSLWDVLHEHTAKVCFF